METQIVDPQPKRRRWPTCARSRSRPAAVGPKIGTGAAHIGRVGPDSARLGRCALCRAFALGTPPPLNRTWAVCSAELAPNSPPPKKESPRVRPTPRPQCSKPTLARSRQTHQHELGQARPNLALNGPKLARPRPILWLGFDQHEFTKTGQHVPEFRRSPNSAEFGLFWESGRK